MANGSPVFWSINVPEVVRAKRFFTALFGWSYSDPGPSGAVRIDGRLGSMHPSGYKDPAALWIGSDDIEAVVNSIGGAGGTASEIFSTPQGLTATIVDPWGVRLALSSRPEGASPVLAGRQHGEVSGWRAESRAVERSAELLGRIFGWSIRAAGPEVSVEGPPLSGTLYPADRPTAPWLCFSVAEMSSTVITIEQLGGRVRSPQEGIVVEAFDDQGYRFGLCQS